MRSALYEWPFAMHLLWEFRCIIDVLLEGIMGLMVAGDFATVLLGIKTEAVCVFVIRGESVFAVALHVRVISVSFHHHFAIILVSCTVMNGCAVRTREANRLSRCFCAVPSSLVGDITKSRKLLPTCDCDRRPYKDRLSRDLCFAGGRQQHAQMWTGHAN